MRLSPDLKSEVDAMMSATYTNDSDIKDFIRLEKQMENTNQHLCTVTQELSTVTQELSTVTQELDTVSQKLETLEIENKNKKGIYFIN